MATTAVRNLGAWFDCNLSMCTHINKICQSVYYQLHNIRQIRKFLKYDRNKDSLFILFIIYYQAACSSSYMARIDYCNGLLYRI